MDKVNALFLHSSVEHMCPNRMFSVETVGPDSPIERQRDCGNGRVVREFQSSLWGASMPSTGKQQQQQQQNSSSSNNTRNPEGK
jgi:hypothetical protein